MIDAARHGGIGSLWSSRASGLPIDARLVLSDSASPTALEWCLANIGSFNGLRSLDVDASKLLGDKSPIASLFFDAETSKHTAYLFQGANFVV